LLCKIVLAGEKPKGARMQSLTPMLPNKQRLEVGMT
jgi:hypothetical protein